MLAFITIVGCISYIIFDEDDLIIPLKKVIKFFFYTLVGIGAVPAFIIGFALMIIFGPFYMLGKFFVTGKE
jgi:hypothetical protein